MGKLIMLPTRNRPSIGEWTTPSPEGESSEERLSRIRKSLERINALMEDIRKEHTRKKLMRIEE